MKSNYKSYIKGFLLGTMVSLCFLGVSMLMAWTSPLGNPPESNVSAPINISSQGQIKQGGLMINTAGADVGFVVATGNVGIGIENPTVKLEIDGKISSTDDISTQGNIYAQGDVCNSAGSCLGDINDFVGSQPLVNSQHDRKDCIAAGGEVVDSLVGYPQCRFNLSSCPTSWVAYGFYTTQPNTCSFGRNYGCTTPETTPWGVWANAGPSVCKYYCAIRGGRPCSCFARVTQIGCY